MSPYLHADDVIALHRDWAQEHAWENEPAYEQWCQRTLARQLVEAQALPGQRGR